MREPVTRALMAPVPAPPRVVVVERPAPPRVPRIIVSLPLEGRVDVEVECEDSERDRLFYSVLADDRNVDLLERAFELAEEDES